MLLEEEDPESSYVSTEANLRFKEKNITVKYLEETDYIEMTI